jgi:hypothetical protein
MLAEQVLADFSQAAGQRRLDVHTDFGCFFSSHGAQSREREPPKIAPVKHLITGSEMASCKDVT